MAWAMSSAQTTSHSTTGKSGQKAATSKSTGASKSSKKRKGKRSRKSSWRRGQQRPDSTRAREIQQALIREHYLSGQPTGVWDQASQSAMERYQADNGWQTKTIPDSRALIKLGLGPDHDHLLNPETAMTSPLGKSNTNSRPNATPASITTDPASTPAKPAAAAAGPANTSQPQR